MRTPDRVLCQPARDTSCAFDAGDQRSHQRGIANEDTERCHTDQRCVPREGARCERQLRFSARDQTSVTSPMRHPRASKKQGHSLATSSRSASCSLRGRETHADNRIISIRVHRTALRRPVVSTSNAESVEVGEDASDLSCPQSQFDREEAHRLQVLQADNEEKDAVTGLSSASRCTACTSASSSKERR